MKSVKHNVVITGVSTGIGRGIARALLQNGSRVFGTVRQLTGLEELSAFGNAFVPLVLDVRNNDSLQQAVTLVGTTLNGEPLDCLINNSGVATGGPLAIQNMAEIREMFDVNVLGLVAVTQAFLPLIQRKRSGRPYSAKIINISSVAGKICAPFLGGYAASKHAVEGLSNSLRRELMPFGIDVVLVGPGNVQTPIWQKALGNNMYEDTPYAGPFKRFLAMAITGSEKGLMPEEIGKLVAHITYSDKPKTRYAPVPQRFPNWIIPRLLPARMLDKMMFKLLGMQKL